MVSQQPSPGSVINLTPTLYLYAADNNETHQLSMAHQWAEGTDGDFGPGIGELLEAVLALHVAYAGDAFVNFEYPPTKVVGAALTMIMATRFTRVADIIN